jgi:hypothetical protein
LAGIYVTDPPLTQRGKRRRGQTLSARPSVEKLEKLREGIGYDNRLLAYGGWR